MTSTHKTSRILAPAAILALALVPAAAQAQKGVGAGYVGPAQTVSPMGGSVGIGGGGFRGGAIGGGARAGGLGGGGFKGVGPNYVGPVQAQGAFGRPAGIGGPGRYGLNRSYGDRGYGYGYRRYGYGVGIGTGVGLGLAAGGLYGGYGYPGAYGYDDAYYGYAPTGYAPAGTEVETDAGSDEAQVSACARRFKTYDPETGTYVGKGGVRRSCP